ncbi:hypothetical protein WJX73_009614 [Symbiochloris irregularis]|uniref:RWD domain-containing protein n=1 Tax=Symbiochloris irregularis TaxID=706552 RepID=A0AAW1NQV8_9CHLO
MDLLSRQLSEFDALQATFVEPGELELGGRITLPATLVGGRPVSLKFTLPSHYPAQPPELQDRPHSLLRRRRATATCHQHQRQR